MRIRKFRVEDIDGVCEVFHDAVHSAAGFSEEQLSAWSPEGAPNREKWLESFAKGYVVVAEEGKVIVGFGDLLGDGMVDHLYVRRAFQGKWIGVALLRELEAEARRCGMKEIFAEASQSGRAMAEKWCGFEFLRKKVRTCRGVDFEINLMRKLLH